MLSLSLCAPLDAVYLFTLSVDDGSVGGGVSGRRGDRSRPFGCFVLLSVHSAAFHVARGSKFNSSHSTGFQWKQWQPWTALVDTAIARRLDSISGKCNQILLLMSVAIAA